MLFMHLDQIKINRIKAFHSNSNESYSKFKTHSFSYKLSFDKK